MISAESYQPFTTDRETRAILAEQETLAIREENKRREELIEDWYAEQDLAEYEQAKDGASVVSWLVTAALLGLFLALAALLGA